MSDLLSFDQVVKIYAHGRHRERVLAGISLSVGCSELVVLIGDRRGGKTTLLRIAGAIIAPTSGTVRLEGIDLAGLRRSQREALLTRSVSWCDRHGPGLELEVRDFVALPTFFRSQGDAYASAERTLAQLGIEDCTRRCWPELSKWEQMCVSLARGIVGRPKLLLADDLLDGIGTLRLLEAGDLLRQVVAETGCTVLLSVSDREAAALADRILRLQDGTLRQVAGPTSNVVALDDRRAAERL